MMKDFSRSKADFSISFKVGKVLFNHYKRRKIFHYLMENIEAGNMRQNAIHCVDIVQSLCDRISPEIQYLESFIKGEI